MSKLDGNLQKRLSHALTKALPTKSDWERMTSYELNESLDKISSLGHIDNIAFEVIRWAISRGRLDDLVNGAQRHNDTNPELLRFYHEIWLPFVDAAKSRQASQIPISIDILSAYSYLDMHAPSSTLSNSKNNRTSETLTQLEDIKTEQPTSNLRKCIPPQQFSAPPLLHNEPIALYYSYVDEDAGLLTLLQRQLVMLSRSDLITVWHRGMIQTGEHEYVEQLKHLNTASIILLLVSPHFLESERTYNEAARAMERFEVEDTVVIPIIWRPTADWQHAPFGGLSALPKAKKALAEYSRIEREKLLEEIAITIRNIVENIRVKQYNFRRGF